ncbi:hypothetical protein KAR48_10225 [bacterium]|nr:hypothetical protein [bacterium]
MHKNYKNLIQSITAILLILLIGCATTQLKQAQTAFDMEDYTLTRRLCRESIAADTCNYNAYLLLSLTHRHTDSLRQAMMTMNLAKKRGLSGDKINQEYSLIYGAMGKSAEAEDRGRIALKWYGLAQEFDPENLSITRILADLNFKLGRLNEAAQNYEKLLTSGRDTLKINPQLRKIKERQKSASTLLVNAEKAYGKGRLKKASNLINRLIKLEANNLDGLYYKYLLEGRQFYESGKHVYKTGALKKLWQAIEALGYASSYREQAPEPYYFIGLSYEKKDKKEYGNAINAFQKAYDLDPSGPYANRSLKKVGELKVLKKKMEKFWGRKRK